MVLDGWQGVIPTWRSSLACLVLTICRHQAANKRSRGTSLHPCVINSPCAVKIAAPTCLERSDDRKAADFAAYMPYSTLVGAMSLRPNSACTKRFSMADIFILDMPSMKTC